MHKGEANFKTSPFRDKIWVVKIRMCMETVPLGTGYIRELININSLKGWTSQKKMLNIFQKIRQKLLQQNRITLYLTYAIGEIFLVVIGILIALQINNQRVE